MADLIPDQPDVLAQAPTSRVSGFQYARAGGYLTQGLDKLSAGLDAVAEPLAQEKAASDLANGTVTRDVNGAVQVTAPGQGGLPILGPAGVAYDHAIAAGMLARGDTQSSADITALRAQHEGDPEGFKTASDAYLQNLKANNGGTPLGEAMFENASRLSTQHYDGMVADQARVDIGNAKQALVDAMTAKTNTLTALASAGKADTPEYQQARADYGALSANLVKNPAFGVSADVQAANDKATDNMLAGYATVGRVEQTYKSSGILAARKELYDNVNDPSLPLSPKDRNTLLEQGDARLRFLTGQNATDIAANAENIRALDEAAKDPRAMTSLSEPVWQASIEKAKSLGDVESVAQLSAMHEVWQRDLATLGMSPNQSLVTHGLGGAPTRGNSAEFQQYNQFLNSGDVQSALRLSEGLRTNAYWDVNHWRTGYGSDTVTRADGTIEPVTATTQITPVDAERDLQRRTALAAQTAQTAIGAGPWAAMSAGAKASLTSVVYNYGHVPNDIAAAATSGDASALASAIASHAGDNGGVNSQRRNAEANAVLGRFGVSGIEGAPAAPAASVNGNAFSADDYRANPFLLSAQVRAIASDSETRNAYARNLLDATEQSIKNGFAPQPNIGAQVFQLATDPNASPEVQQKAQRVAGLAQGMTLAGAAVNVPPGQGQALLDHYQALAQSSGDLFQQSLAEEFRASLASRQKQLKDDPWGFATASNWIKNPPNPLSFDDPLALGVALHQRDYAASAIAARTGDNTISALSPDDLPQVRSVLENGTPQQQATFWQAVGTLSPDRRAATLRELGGNDPATMAKVAAGSLMTAAPDVAQSIMRGQNAIKADKQWAPDEQATASVGKSGYSADLDKNLPATIFNVNDRTNPAGAYATTSAMVRARYADLAAQAGDKAYSPDRVAQAVNDVTGGILAMNGGSFIAPVRGMDQGRFDGVIRGVTDADLRDVTTLSGRPITADYLRSNGQLENAGDGKYFIRLGSDPSRPVYAYSGAKGETPTRFILDLNNRPAAPLSPLAQQAPTPRTMR